MSAPPVASPAFGAQAHEKARAKRERVRGPELKLVEAHKRRLNSPRMRLFAWFAGAAVVLFGLVAFHVLLTQGQFKLQSLENKANKEQANYERFRLQVAQLESPSRITNEAVNRLGMVTAEKVTPVTPGAAQLPRQANGSPAPLSGGATAEETQSVTDDPGRWTQVKPELSSTVNY